MIDSSNSSFYVDPGNLSYLLDVRASVFKDRDNITYYVDPADATTSANFKGAVVTDSTVKGHRFVDYHDSGFYVDPASTSKLSVVEASVFNDLNDTSYYVNPSSTGTSANF